MFEIVEGMIGVMPDPTDNPDGHVVPHSDAGVRISVEVGNVGDEPGTATVGVEVDDVFVTEWESDEVGPGQTAVGFIDLGRLAAGTRMILAFVNPGFGRQGFGIARINLP
ncbi:hypothetical protein ALI22I_01655 [Saccharothrix sp. ALI-22-I]|uniref:hypothetical protein n=1 Tax=Saccharothrix sp. ALI-22-I TaxID=1933778 RepID=UPI00097BBE2B|nr:hypothetical protein [Saccharothrix sp. ALI-22-I]ONI92848.1 hypothetical protein ALI22I_01655 [Saccharothrix sp. ALI-22-I]